MITGRVNADFEPIVSIYLSDAGREPSQVDAIVDTGFNGWLTLPLRLIDSLGLPWRRTGRATLADGFEVTFDIYEACVIWNGKSVKIPIDESDSMPLLGMKLMDGCDLSIRVRPEGIVEIRSIAPAC
jgi:clan AA aspartic protease